MRMKADARLKTLDFSNGQVLFLMEDGYRLKVPLSRFPPLARADAEARRGFKVASDKQSVSWSSLSLTVQLTELQS